MTTKTLQTDAKIASDSFQSPKNLPLIILVASLGYFVDIYDLIIFSIVRVKSLTDLGVTGEQMRTQGEFVINMQVGGLFLGGFIWGIIGDKFGRLKVLFGSILIYSLANIASGFVHDVNSYAIVRFIAGLGLAGELGAGITLVSESMPKNKRGYGTMIVGGVGMLGTVAAFLTSDWFDWRTAYFVGGGLGLILLIMRVGILEPKLYSKTKDKGISRGDLKLIFTSKERFLRYLYCICLGITSYFVMGIMLTQSPEIGAALGSPITLIAGLGLMYHYIGVTIGEVLGGFFAQLTKSRRLTLVVLYICALITSVVYLNSEGITQTKFNYLAFFMGIGAGYWATFVTVSAEQFGTNLRATVTTTVPNIVRGCLIPITLIYNYLIPKFGIINSVLGIMVVLTIISLFAVSQLKESFNKDLNYIEE
ncbi:MFS transporter [Pedobacter sp. AW1-32]|uniref:MFS transporter n=1 Tax=Pedobacter sp. AW1-32 TaxID=3383026 RepID=UPI003FEFE93D